MLFIFSSSEKKVIIAVTETCVSVCGGVRECVHVFVYTSYSVSDCVLYNTCVCECLSVGTLHSVELNSSE